MQHRKSQTERHYPHERRSGNVALIAARNPSTTKTSQNTENTEATEKEQSINLRDLRASVFHSSAQLSDGTSEAWQPDPGALPRLHGRNSRLVSQSTHNGIRLAVAALFAFQFLGGVIDWEAI